MAQTPSSIITRLQDVLNKNTDTLDVWEYSLLAQEALAGLFTDRFANEHQVNKEKLAAFELILNRESGQLVELIQTGIGKLFNGPAYGIFKRYVELNRSLKKAQSYAEVAATLGQYEHFLIEEIHCSEVDFQKIADKMREQFANKERMAELKRGAPSTEITGTRNR